MAEYPEHEKLHKIVQESQSIGEFLDVGLPKMGMQIYEEITRSCEAHIRCVTSRWHTQEELATIINPDSYESDGRVQITEWWPTHRSVLSILAEYFGIDQAKIDAEKIQMLAKMSELAR